MPFRKAAVGCLWCVFVIGCASSAHMTRLSSNIYTSKPKGCAIEILTEMPTKKEVKYEELGIVTGVSGQHWAANKTLDAMLPPMKDRACELGADALVLKNVEEGGFAYIQATQGKASGVAIKFLK